MLGTKKDYITGKIKQNNILNGQVKRTGEDRLPNKAFRCNPPGRKKRGKPKKMYELPEDMKSKKGNISKSIW